MHTYLCTGTVKAGMLVHRVYGERKSVFNITSSLLYSTSRETRVGLSEASIMLRLKVAEVSG
jgi:hypothetical protein